MDTKSKILIGLFFALVVAATVWKYHVFVIKQDFIILNIVSCDPTLEPCFISEDESPYKKISKNAKNVPDCESEECPELSCEVGEADCAITLCSDYAIEEGESCIYEPEAIPEEVVTESDSDDSEEITE